MLDYKLENKKNEIELKFNRLIDGKELNYIMPNNLEQSWPIIFYTATTDMRDYIGNIQNINNNKCSVLGYFRTGKKQKLDNIIIKDEKINKVGQRVMITEHVNVKGNFELLATTKRIINLKNSNLNFINIGWSNNNESIYNRIDIYTGEHMSIKGEPIVR